MRPEATIRFAIHGPIAREDVPGLHQRVCAVLASAGPGLLACELADVAADVTAVDALARLALAARRHGCHVRVLGASPELRELVAFMGLDAVLSE